MIKGVVKTQAIVEIAVRLTDRARLALAIWLIKLLVVPGASRQYHHTYSNILRQ